VPDRKDSGEREREKVQSYLEKTGKNTTNSGPRNRPYHN